MNKATRLWLQPAYVLHRRPYRETSFLIDLFTEEGRFTVVAKGVRKVRSSTAGLLQPFIPLLVSCSGKGELLALNSVEPQGEGKQLQGDCLIAGFYLNELLMSLLEKWDPHPGLYAVYEKTISALRSGVLQQQVLRSFEKFLLEELGYGILPKSDISLHNTFSPDRYYRFTPDQGFVVSEFTAGSQQKPTIFSGKSLLAIAKEDWREEESIQDAKRLMRLVLTPLLGVRPIYSRKLFIQREEEHEE